MRKTYAIIYMIILIAGVIVIITSLNGYPAEEFRLKDYRSLFAGIVLTAIGMTGGMVYGRQ